MSLIVIVMASPCVAQLGSNWQDSTNMPCTLGLQGEESTYQTYQTHSLM